MGFALGGGGLENLVRGLGHLRSSVLSWFLSLFLRFLGWLDLRRCFQLGHLDIWPSLLLPKDPDDIVFLLDVSGVESWGQDLGIIWLVVVRPGNAQCSVLIKGSRPVNCESGHRFWVVLVYFFFGPPTGFFVVLVRLQALLELESCLEVG